MTDAPAAVPRGTLAGFTRYIREDMLSGFLVFLIALPLCLGISIASGYPATAGILTAIVGGLITPWLSNSELTIKGPAAGLIVVALGCVTGFADPNNPDSMMAAYRLALGVGVVAAAIQILFGLFRTGFLGEFFPTSVVHGMLAAIGIIIAAKHIHMAAGVKPLAKEPIGWITEIPHSLMHLNPEIALIGSLSLLILFGKPFLTEFLPAGAAKLMKMVPSQMVVILIAVPLGILFDLDHEHTYTFMKHQYSIPNAKQVLVDLPASFLSAVHLPDFSGVLTAHGLQYIVMFSLIGTLESLLSAKAIDLIDPCKRKTNFDKDVLAVGVANLVAAALGGLPMISEIVRSKANIDNGAKTRFANMWHGVFLLLAVSLIPFVIHRIPLAALAAMLIYTGIRLASPREFLAVYRVGPEQLIIFASTLVGVLAIDLLWGIAIGIGVKFLLHAFNGVPLASFFAPQIDVRETAPHTYNVEVNASAVFSNWLMMRSKLNKLTDAKSVTVDLSQSKLVDHTVMEKLHEMETDFHHRGCEFVIIGLDDHRSFSKHPFATRKLQPEAGGSSPTATTV